jgi:calcineurin-like phosphoesterase family protein
MRIPRRTILNLLPALAGGLALGPLLRSRAEARPGRETSLRFLATADSGSGDSNQRAVGRQMGALHRRDPVELVLMAGDNIYPSGDLALVKATFQRPYRELLAAGVPFHAVLGNHDNITGNGKPQVAYPPFGMKGRWYSLRRGPVAFFMLDTNVKAPWQLQLPWLKRELAASDAPWKVVVGHHPIYSSGFYGNDPAAIARLTPLFRRHGVQLYINGHDHNYERSKPLQGTTYLTVGGGGASLRPVKAEAQSARAVSVHSFAELQVRGERLTIDAWDLKGNRIDRAVLNRAGAGVPG